LLKKTIKKASKSSTKKAINKKKTTKTKTKRTIAKKPNSKKEAINLIPVCSKCGSTNLHGDSLNKICVECGSHKLTLINEKNKENYKNKILQEKFEAKFHEYKNNKHKAISGKKFLRILGTIIIIILFILTILLMR
jgi:Zn finger protein HypA/HybF involved in hydrogenase expression